MDQRKREEKRDVTLITVYFYGKKYDVPESFTIIQAYEFTGHQYTKGCGCRGGACGACGTVYRLPGSYKIEVGLACQTVVQPDMYIVQIPFFPVNKSIYDIENVSPTIETLGKIYPEVFRCLQCNTCTKMCPQDIKVMECMAAAHRWDIETMAIQSMSCVMCGLCAVRCPAEIVPYTIMLLSRRIYGKHILKPSKNVRSMLKQIKDRQFDAELDTLTSLDIETLQEIYKKQQADKRSA